jgi:hypothetical protein
LRAIANIAAFHFGFIEQAGSSLYATLSQKVSSPEVLKITLSIGGDELCHFLEWVDFSGNSAQPPVAPLAAANGGSSPTGFSLASRLNSCNYWWLWLKRLMPLSVESASLEGLI